ncbi:MAG: RimK family alpha-L-glutamate ligase [Eubacteriales bacterium]|nr:RimK family alpha-L-glutamate ligase [Eubacteriales bacterium]
MPHGLMVVNAFLRTAKFDEIYHTLLTAAQRRGMALDMTTNAALSPVADGPDFDASRYDFVLFWDKDVALARQLEARGLRLFNSADGVLRCDDKSLTYLCLQKSGVPMPETILAPKTFPAVGYPTTDFVDEAARRLGLPLVLKECFGSFGQQVYLFDEAEALRQKVISLAGTPMLFQRLVKESYGRDARVNVVGGRVVASLLRSSQNGDFRSNLTLGGAMRSYQPTQEEEALALRAVRELGLDFAGVDVLFGKDGPLLCEVNSNAHFKTTLACTGVNMADSIMAHIADTLEARA